MQIRANQLTKKVQLPSGESLTILQEISLTIDSGEKLGILGISGSGKSTLLGLLAGLDIPTTGNIYWQDINLSELDEDGRAALRLHRAGFIFQSFELLPSYTALENVLLPLELANQDNALTLAKEALMEVGLDHRMNHHPSQLSGGEQQRVAIARAFATQPKVLFADEPTGNLDEKTGARIIQLLADLNSRHKTTLVCVTHDPALSKVCDRNLRLKDSHLQQV